MTTFKKNPPGCADGACECATNCAPIFEDDFSGLTVGDTIYSTDEMIGSNWKVASGLWRVSNVNPSTGNIDGGKYPTTGDSDAALMYVGSTLGQPEIMIRSSSLQSDFYSEPRCFVGGTADDHFYSGGWRLSDPAASGLTSCMTLEHVHPYPADLLQSQSVGGAAGSITPELGAGGTIQMSLGQNPAGVAGSTLSYDQYVLAVCPLGDFYMCVEPITPGAITGVSVGMCTGRVTSGETVGFNHFVIYPRKCARAVHLCSGLSGQLGGCGGTCGPLCIGSITTAPANVTGAILTGETVGSWGDPLFPELRPTTFNAHKTIMVRNITEDNALYVEALVQTPGMYGVDPGPLCNTNKAQHQPNCDTYIALNWTGFADHVRVRLGTDGYAYLEVLAGSTTPVSSLRITAPGGGTLWDTTFNWGCYFPGVWGYCWIGLCLSTVDGTNWTASGFAGFGIIGDDCLIYDSDGSPVGCQNCGSLGARSQVSQTFTPNPPNIRQPVVYGVLDYVDPDDAGPNVQMFIGVAAKDNGTHECADCTSEVVQPPPPPPPPPACSGDCATTCNGPTDPLTGFPTLARNLGSCDDPDACTCVISEAYICCEHNVCFMFCVGGVWVNTAVPGHAGCGEPPPTITCGSPDSGAFATTNCPCVSYDGNVQGEACSDAGAGDDGHCGGASVGSACDPDNIPALMMLCKTVGVAG